MPRISFLAIFLLALSTHSLSGQVVQIEGTAEGRAWDIVQQVLARQQYLLLDRDTILPADFRAEGDLIIADADVRLEGAVQGAVAVLGGRFFVRPGANVTGPIAVIDGLALPSGLATVGEIVEGQPGMRVEVDRTDDALRVQLVPPPPPPRLDLPGIGGLRGIAYDRVNGLSVGWGPQLRLTERVHGPDLQVWAAYHSARRAVGGGAELGTPLGAGLRGAVRAERTTFTNEHWVRGDLMNSLAAFATGRDVRDYFESDRIQLSLSRPVLGPVVEGSWGIAPRLSLQTSQDRSLETRAPWSVLGRENMRRPNPPIDDGRLTSASAGLDLEWRGRSTSLLGSTTLEHSPQDWGDFAFTQWVGDGQWWMAALWNHSISVYTRGMGTLGGDPAPRQRWTFVGGDLILPTLPLGALSGDNLVFIRSTYLAPLEFVQLPFVGSPSLVVVHATGTAWATGAPAPAWEQNLGAGFRISLLDVMFWIDPTAPTRPRLLIGLAWPG